MTPFLESTAIVDWQDVRIRTLASELKRNADDDETLARLTFEWVRDEVQHSLDFQRTEVTCRASDVLAQRTGYCYAKSHLLAALLRANGIPAGFCYQRLSLHDDGPPFCLHGLNAVYLRDYGWYRIDPRGNKNGVNAEFTPPVEQLAFSTTNEGELDFAEIWPEPLLVVVQSLVHATSVQSLAICLPDLSSSDMRVVRDSSPSNPVFIQTAR